jgi:proteasome maturation protein
MRIVPASAPSSSTSHNITYESTAHPLNAVHDSLRHGLTSSTSAAAVQPGTTHALQARLEQWNATQEKLRLGMQRSNFGLGLPLRVMMEKKIVMEVRLFFLLPLPSRSTALSPSSSLVVPLSRPLSVPFEPR